MSFPPLLFYAMPRAERLELDAWVRRYAGHRVTPDQLEVLRQDAAVCWHKSRGERMVESALRGER